MRLWFSSITFERDSSPSSTNSVLNFHTNNKMPRMQNQVTESRNLVRAAASDGASLHQLHPRGCEIASAKHAIGHRLERYTSEIGPSRPCLKNSCPQRPES